MGRLWSIDIAHRQGRECDKRKPKSIMAEVSLEELRPVGVALSLYPVALPCLQAKLNCTHVRNGDVIDDKKSSVGGSGEAGDVRVVHPFRPGFPWIFARPEKMCHRFIAVVQGKGCHVTASAPPQVCPGTSSGWVGHVYKIGMNLQAIGSESMVRRLR
ncbi:hypothetical protein K461DRAFT_158910 [Myriangium duriaei CBS 260.36]|uniref:Uncharacterized protein n=1 Tax=Myriangium duriaei CBS 260.36 TaxID=1168546 RepID=A0A9P4J3U8_9PEZI|nr:hypothetical protein K461DRAFT_158910 [Myriangium duriaei CBS 260.36]